MAWTGGDHAEARSLLEKSVGLWRELKDEFGLAHTLHFLAMEMLAQCDSATARSLAEESVRIFRGGEDAFGLATSLASLGVVVLDQEDYALASSLLEESLALFRANEDYWGLTLPLRHLGVIALRQGDYARAATLLKETLVLLRQLGEKTFISRSLESLAAVVAMRDDHRRAARLFGAGEALREEIGASILPYHRPDYDHAVTVARAGMGEEAFAAAWAEGKAMTLDEAVAYALETPTTPVLSYPAALTDREAEVLRLVAKGFTNAQVAERLFISPRTVNAHLRTIYGKLGVSSRAAATRFAVEHGLS